jgi:hypothetical protein
VLVSDPYVSLYLLEHGADVNTADDKGMSALLAVAGRGNAAVAQVLLSKGAGTTLRDRDGKTAPGRGTGRPEDDATPGEIRRQAAMVGGITIQG